MKRKPIDILNEIRMHRALRPHQSALLLEGRTDCSYYRNIICRESCLILSTEGKVIARQAARMAIEHGVDGVAAVLDRDHDALLGHETDHPNIIYTDENDFEITVIRSPAFERYLNEYLDYQDRTRVLNGTNFTTVADFLLATVGPIGVVRFLNSRETWELKCRDIDIGQVFDRESMSVDGVRVIDHLFEISDRPNAPAEQVRETYQETMAIVGDVAQYAAGHDATKLLAYLLSNRIWLDVEIEVGAYQIEQGLRLTFSDEHFANSGIFHGLKRWEADNVPFRLCRQS